MHYVTLRWYLFFVEKCYTFNAKTKERGNKNNKETISLVRENIWSPSLKWDSLDIERKESGKSLNGLAMGVHVFTLSPSRGYLYHRFYYTVVSHSHITLTSHVRKVIPFYLNDPVLQFSPTRYHNEGTSL